MGSSVRNGNIVVQETRREVRREREGGNSEEGGLKGGMGDSAIQGS
jgi:hypothetical protein